MFQGIIPAFVTPLQDDNTINHEATKKLLDFELSQGADGFYICGATGESIVLQPEARIDLAKLVVNHLAGRVPCISHIAAIDLTTTLRLAKEAEAAGCDAVAAIPPIYFGYSDDDIYNYYRAISDVVHIPVMIYYHPAAGKVMSAEFVARLFEIENIQAVKWSKPDYYEMLRLKDITHGEMNIINGPDETLICGLAVGADAGIGTTYNFMLPRYKKLYNAMRQGDLATAHQMQNEASRIIAAFCKYPVISAVKLIMRKMGFDVGEATYPMTHFTSEQEEQILSDLRTAGLAI